LEQNFLTLNRNELIAATRYFAPASSSKAVDLNEGPATLSDIFKILESRPGVDLAMTHSRPHLLGWKGVTLDYQSLQLALALMEKQAQ
jgi:hypothetical protein